MTSQFEPEGMMAGGNDEAAKPLLPGIFYALFYSSMPALPLSLHIFSLALSAAILGVIWSDLWELPHWSPWHRPWGRRYYYSYEDATTETCLMAPLNTGYAWYFINTATRMMTLGHRLVTTCLLLPSII